jgi:hypothetical protein
MPTNATARGTCEMRSSSGRDSCARDSPDDDCNAGVGYLAAAMKDAGVPYETIDRAGAAVAAIESNIVESGPFLT